MGQRSSEHAVADRRRCGQIEGAPALRIVEQEQQRMQIIVPVDPAHDLPAIAQAAAQTEFERQLHFFQHAAIGMQD